MAGRVMDVDADPTLSNTHMMVEALYASGLPADDPAFSGRSSLSHAARCSARTNDQPFAREGGDGGFIYSPANDGESKAETIEVNGRVRLRSYGSMTYAGFKSMLYARVDRGRPAGAGGMGMDRAALHAGLQSQYAR